MRRRDVITLLGSAAAAWPRAARAQQGTRVRRVGALMAYPETDQEAQARLQAFRQALADLGWVEGRNLRMDVRWAGIELAAQRSLARELVSLGPDVFLGSNTTSTLALQDAIRT